MIASDSYEEILKYIIRYGKRQENRTDIDSIAVPHVTYYFDLKDGFPLISSRKIFFKSALIELEGFLKCKTSKKWYQDQGTNIWTAWSNPVKAKKEYEYRLRSCLDLDETPETYKEVQEQIDDLGPFYAWQMRKFGEHYGEWEFYEVGEEGPDGQQQYDDNRNGVDKGFDQIAYILKELKENPESRRLLCNMWEPNQMHMAALPSCHYSFVVTVIDNKINLMVTFRSWDFVLGGPTNIAYYATLMLLLSKYSGIEPGMLTIIGANTHVYINHLEGAQEQLGREKRGWPTLEITHPEPFKLTDKGLEVQWTHNDFRLENYNPHPPIKFEVAV